MVGSSSFTSFTSFKFSAFYQSLLYCFAWYHHLPRAILSITVCKSIQAKSQPTLEILTNHHLTPRVQEQGSYYVNIDELPEGSDLAKTPLVNAPKAMLTKVQ